MDAFKRVSAVSTRHDYWFDFESKQQNKRRGRKKARHVCNASFQKIFKEALDNCR